LVRHHNHFTVFILISSFKTKFQFFNEDDKNRFEIHTSENTIQLIADSPENVDLWINTLKFEITKMVDLSIVNQKKSIGFVSSLNFNHRSSLNNIYSLIYIHLHKEREITGEEKESDHSKS
jgi:hypothetical protein